MEVTSNDAFRSQGFDEVSVERCTPSSHAECPTFEWRYRRYFLEKGGKNPNPDLSGTQKNNMPFSTLVLLRHCFCPPNIISSVLFRFICRQYKFAHLKAKETNEYYKTTTPTIDHGGIVFPVPLHFCAHRLTSRRLNGRWEVYNLTFYKRSNSRYSKLCHYRQYQNNELHP